MNDAFSDYAVSMELSADQFDLMMRQRGLEPDASRVADIDGRPAALWLVSIRNGCSYLISSGTRPAFRSRGLALALGRDCLAGLRSRGASSLRLEVLANNVAAIRLYENLGMTVRRRLDCYEVPGMEGSASDFGVRKADWREIGGQAGGLRDWEPTWQNSDHAATATLDSHVCVSARKEGLLFGYALALPSSSTLLQLAVRPDQRRRGRGTALLAGLSQLLPGPGLRIVNVLHDDTGFAGFMRAIGARHTVRQLEMIRPM